jgi:hypothetical protein
MNVPPNWTRAGEINGTPVWRWKNEPFHAVTCDMDQLLFLDAALTDFDQMTSHEFHRYVTRAADPAGDGRV